MKKRYIGRVIYASPIQTITHYLRSQRLSKAPEGMPHRAVEFIPDLHYIKDIEIETHDGKVIRLKNVMSSSKVNLSKITYDNVIDIEIRKGVLSATELTRISEI